MSGNTRLHIPGQTAIPIKYQSFPVVGATSQSFVINNQPMVMMVGGIPLNLHIASIIQAGIGMTDLNPDADTALWALEQADLLCQIHAERCNANQQHAHEENDGTGETA